MSWQNELNSLNKPFFDLCDGIFLNYTWTCPDKDGEDGEVSLDNLANSISALDNDSRRTDIFVGVDVFGRGCIGGGGFQCWEPLKEIRSRGLSAAIFAPGWTYELPLREGTVATDWIPRENLFWRLLEGWATSGTKYEKIIPSFESKLLFCKSNTEIFYQFSSNSFTNFSRQVSLETACPIFVSRLQPSSASAIPQLCRS